MGVNGQAAGEGHYYTRSDSALAAVLLSRGCPGSDRLSLPMIRTSFARVTGNAAQETRNKFEPNNARFSLQINKGRTAGRKVG